MKLIHIVIFVAFLAILVPRTLIGLYELTKDLAIGIKNSLKSNV